MGYIVKFETKHQPFGTACLVHQAGAAPARVSLTSCVPPCATPPPVGAVLTHGNLVANAAGTATLLDKWTPGDKHLSYLPLAHIYERVNIVLVGRGRVVGKGGGN